VSKYCIQVSWSEVPHLSDKDKDELRASIPPHQLEARERGIPVLGSGVIYPVPEAAFVIDPIELPVWWPRAYAMDVGWNRTAAVWGAWDRETDTIYIYSEHYRGQAEPSIHADAIKARGDWITGAIDPASSGSNQKDGTQLIEEYRKLGLMLVPADNSVEAGIHAVYRRLSTGRLKVFKNCAAWLSEFRIYRRDEKGKVVKQNDHLMDCTRYLTITGMRYASVDMTHDDYMKETSGHSGAAARSSVTGY
jgi:hypothetical protein